MPRKKVRDSQQDPFRGKTDEEIDEIQKRRVKAYKKTMAKKTPLERATRAAKMKMAWNRKSTEEQKEIREKLSRVRKEAWASRSIEERLAISAKISAAVRKAKREGRFFSPLSKKKGE